MFYLMAVPDSHADGNYSLVLVGKREETNRYDIFFGLDVYAGLFSNHIKYYGVVETVVV